MVYSLQNTIRQKTEMLRVKNQLVRQWGSSVVDHAGMGEDSPSEEVRFRSQSVREYLDDVEKTSKSASIIRPSEPQKDINFT